MASCEPCAAPSCPCHRLVGGSTRKVFELRCELQPCEGNALHAAAAKGDAEEAAQLLRSADVDACDALGCTALHFAAASSSPDVVRLLLEAGASVSQHSYLGLTPLHALCCGLQHSYPWEAASEAVLRLLLDAGADATAAMVPTSAELEVLAGDTPLAMLAQHAFPGAGAAPVVACLLAAGADPLLPSSGLLTSALEFACAAGDVEVVRLMLDAAPTSGCYRKDIGFNPSYYLRLAVAHESVDVVALLLDPPPSMYAILLQTASPDPTSVLLSDEGSSLSASEASFQAACTENADIFEPVILEACLHDAIGLGSLPLVRLLVTAGASASGYTSTPRLFELYQSHICEMGFRSRFPILHSLDRMRDYADKPLTLAISQNQDEIAVYLLKRATPHPMPDRLNRTSLHWATILGKLRIMHLLLESRLYHQQWEGTRIIDQRDAQDWSPLAIALHYRNAQAVEMLVAYGASLRRPVHTKEGRFMPPVHKAICMLDDEDATKILMMLLENGAPVDHRALELASELGRSAGVLELLHICHDAATGS